MTYTATEKQKKQLKLALRELKARNLSDERVLEAINDWKDYLKKTPNDNPARDNIKTPLARSTYAKYRNEGFFDTFPKAKLIYEFLESEHTKMEFRVFDINAIGVDVSTAEGLLVYELMQFFESENKARNYKRLSCFVGKYSLYRRAWMPDHKGYFICSPLEIKQKDNLFHLSMSQQYEYGTFPVNEQDRGILLPYSSNFISLTRSHQSIKFLSIHDVYPDVKKGNDVDYFSGNLMSISGNGPHESHQFICKKSKSNDDFGLFHKKELKKNPSKKDVKDKLFPKKKKKAPKT